MKQQFLFLLILTAIACSTKKSSLPSGIIEPAKMQLIVYDVMSADEFLANYHLTDTSGNKQRRSTYYAQIFNLHKTSKEAFYKSYAYYQQNPVLQKQLFDSVQSMAARQNGKLLKKLKQE